MAPSTELDPYSPAGDPTQRRTAVLARSLTRADILDGIRSRRVYATEDRNLKVLFTINGRHAGDIVALPPARTA